MKNKQHLYDSSVKLLQKGFFQKFIQSEKALRNEVQGHRMRALYFMANEDDAYRVELELVTALKLEYIHKY
ncbi:hypothetical protein OAP18_02395, partial [Gammaproteobacteria bacterium]|nr:hypothetical protein [Gammaproteobacteria bacterium]